MRTLRDKLRELILFYKEEYQLFSISKEHPGSSRYGSEEEMIEGIITDWFKREND